MLAFGFSICSTSSVYGGIDHLGVPCLYAFCLLFSASASALLFSLLGTSGSLDNRPFAKIVNVIVARRKRKHTSKREK